MRGKAKSGLESPIEDESPVFQDECACNLRAVMGPLFPCPVHPDKHSFEVEGKHSYPNQKVSGHLNKYLEYITNTGGNPTIEQFDEDWEPAGEMLRRQLKNAGLIAEVDGKIVRTDG